MPSSLHSCGPDHMIYHSPFHVAHQEQSIRNRMQQEGVHHEAYEYLVAMPYPRDYLYSWMRDQFESGTYMRWHGWCMFKHESDAQLMVLTWLLNPD